MSNQQQENPVREVACLPPFLRTSAYVAELRRDVESSAASRQAMEYKEF